MPKRPKFVQRIMPTIRLESSARNAYTSPLAQHTPMHSPKERVNVKASFRSQKMLVTWDTSQTMHHLRVYQTCGQPDTHTQPGSNEQACQRLKEFSSCGRRLRRGVAFMPTSLS